MMRFEHEWVVNLLWGIPLLVAAYYAYLRWQRRSIERWGEADAIKALMPLRSRGILWFKMILFAGAYAMLVIALANPQQGSKVETAKRLGIDIMIALDVSNSMLAEDVQPNRLERTKQSLQRFINRLQGDRIGIVAFAGTATRILPLTTDYAAAQMITENISTGIIATQGTAIGAAITSAVEGLPDVEKRAQVVVVVSDGENHEDDAMAAAEEANKKGIRIYSIGIGSPAGAPIPAVRGSGDFKRMSDGTTVITRLNEVMLQKIAAAGEGSYYSGMLPVSGFMALADDLEKLEASEVESRVFSDYESFYQYPLALALMLLIIEQLMGNRRLKKPSWLSGRLRIKPMTPTRKTARLGILAGLIMLSFQGLAQIENPDIRKGNKLYRQGDYPAAETEYRKALEKVPLSNRALFNLGAAQYKQGNYEEAARIYSDLSASGIPDDMKAKALHNLGNARVKTEEYGPAVDAYKQALRINPKDDDTRYNLEYARRLLTEQQQQQQQKNQEQKEENKDNKQESQENEKSSEQNDEKKEESGKDKEMSRKDAERLLDALKNKEKEVMDKLQKEQKRAVKVIIEKDW